MSGTASGLILLPLAMAYIPMIIARLAADGALASRREAAAEAARYERESRKMRENLIRTAFAENSSLYRDSMFNDMKEQTEVNVEASEQMMSALEDQRKAVREAAEQADAEAYGRFVGGLRERNERTLQEISKIQEEAGLTYRCRIRASMEKISSKMDERQRLYMEELAHIQGQAEQKKQRAKEIARSYIEEGRELLIALEGEHKGRKFAEKQLQTLTQQCREAEILYEKEQYEAAIAAAKDNIIAAVEETYEADAKMQEWENYRKLALVLSADVRTYIESQGFITEEAKAYVEEKAGRKLEDEIVGVSLSEYTDKNAKGQTKYDFLLYKARKAYEALRAPQAEEMTTAQLKEYVEFLNKELYPDILQCINKAVINMNNAFSRQNISEEIIDFFEEHNFVFNGYAYDDDCHDKALHIGLENPSNGEELIITLAPEFLENGDLQTRVDLKQIKGDETNEERKAYYRSCVEEVVKGRNPHAQVSIACREETRNKLAEDTRTKEKLKSVRD